MNEKNKSSLLSLIINNEAISLALITAFSLLVSFAWEGGKLLFYGAPWRFMELNTLTILIASMVFILVFSPITMQILFCIQKFKSEKLFFRCIIIALFYSFPFYIAKIVFFTISEVLIINVSLSVLSTWLVFLILLFLLPAIPILLSCKMSLSKYYRNLYKLERFLSFRGKSSLAKYGLIFTIAVYLLITVFFSHIIMHLM